MPDVRIGSVRREQRGGRRELPVEIGGEIFRVASRLKIAEEERGLYIQQVQRSEVKRRWGKVKLREGRVR